MKQKQIILIHLETKGSIDSMTAIVKYGITRLASYIFQLRNDGYLIESERKKVITRQGAKTTIAVYKLKCNGERY
tara:strand:+ start:127 stop:351 length:225 start_codon:yes stop_codon:yes gene_type:complete